MKRVNIFRFIVGLIAIVQLGVMSYAQTSQDIEMAKAYAKSMGYSDSDIEQAMTGISSGGMSPSTTTATLEAPREDIDRNAQRDSLQQESLMQQRDSLAQSKEAEEERRKNEIFGHNIFNIESLNFVPNYNIPTPADYKLSAGDEVIVDVWGDVITNITATITPEGYISIPNMGLMYLAGQTVATAEESIRQGLSKIYARINNEPHDNHVKLSLGKTRSVTVNVVGDVTRPGSYTVPSLSTIAMVMYMSGGPEGIGSVRNINLYRNNKLISKFDVYDFLINGVYGNNIRLEDNDIISVAPYDGIIALEGGVKRPMRYEIVDGETLDKILGYAGGFSHSAFGGSVVVERVSADDSTLGATSQSFVVASSDFGGFELKGGDKIIVSENLDRFSNRATLSGAVWREGSYAIGDGENQASNLFELIELAGGLRDDAFLKRGYIERYGDNRIREQITFSPMEILLKSTTIEILPDDNVRIFTMDEVMTKPTVNIAGEINNPDQYEYRRNMTLGDLIIMAGGVTDGATLSNVEIARRKLDVDNQDASDSVAIVMTLDLLKQPSEAEITLSPYDMVFVRKSINYEPQMAVKIRGEVNYPGTYVIENNTVRLSDLIRNSGGLSKDAYINGASLRRMVSEEDLSAIEMSQDITSSYNILNKKDNITEIKDKMGRVALDLAKAMENPGSVSDLVLKEGDVITIPQLDNTVSVTGHVMNPNSLVFEEKTNLKDYISAAGGYQKRAMKRRIYVVQMNGMMAKRGNKNFEITPGSTIVVPEKPVKIGFAQTATVATTFSTLLIAILSLVL